MQDKPFEDLFPELGNGELPLSYLTIARMPRKSLPELTKRDRLAGYAPQHQCFDLPIIGADVLRGSVWFEGDETE
ncbi:MAG: hypothetical protein AAGA62_19265 [Bacteroidota bacterium]